MKVRFRIHYHTQWGQRLYVSGPIAVLGKEKEEHALPMRPLSDGFWEAEIDLKNSRAKDLSYKYFLKDEVHNITFWESGDYRNFEIDKKNFSDVVLEDSWKPKKDPQNLFDTAAFTEAVFRNTKTKKASKKVAKITKPLININVEAPRLTEEYDVRILGSAKEFGNWDATKAKKLTHEAGSNTWSISIQPQAKTFSFNYKFAIYHTKKNELVEFETGEDRYLNFGNAKVGHLIQVSCGKFRYDRPLWKGAGVAIPVFSLRTKKGMGVGEFTDIKALVDWSKEVGMKMVQILPVNDTIATYSWVDSYPYAAISVYGMHPMYINLEEAGTLKSKKRMTEFSKKREALNKLDAIDYEEVMNTKLAYLKELWVEQKEAFYKNSDAKKFIKDQNEWLLPYAAFSYLRDKTNEVDFSKWGEFAKFDRKKVNALFTKRNKACDDVHFYVFVQYHLHKQLLEASQYAKENKVVLKGDIPIGIYRNSADAWTEPKLYNMNGQAGAPPDDFAVNGQNWGFPTYNWDEMKKDGYKWWTSRLTHLSQYFEAFRIDHILGFFRIWEIPMHSVQGLLGQFRPAISLKKNELTQRGIPFDFDRFCTPYIRNHFLEEYFQERTDWVKKTCLDDQGEGVFKFKKKFDTQRKVQAQFDTLISKAKKEEEKARLEEVRDNLYSLHNEILLLPALTDKDGTEFAPRVTMNLSRSYQELDNHTKANLWDLYIDYFFRRQEGLWEDQAMQKLPAIKEATKMLICGEDLGMVPDCVPGVMDELDILSLEIQRMPKDPKIEFGHTTSYPYMSVASTSTHDMAPVRGWWEEDSETAQKFYNSILGHWGASPFYCEPWIGEEILVQHLNSESMWTVFPIQDILAIDNKLRREDASAEQINIPAIKHHYWRYRFHLNIEDLVKEKDFNLKIAQLLKASGRNTDY